MTHSGEARDRLSQQAYTTLEPGNPLGLVAGSAAELSEVNGASMEQKLRQAQERKIDSPAEYLGQQIDEAEQTAEIMSKAETDRNA